VRYGFTSTLSIAVEEKRKEGHAHNIGGGEGGDMAIKKKEKGGTERSSGEKGDFGRLGGCPYAAVSSAIVGAGRLVRELLPKGGGILRGKRRIKETRGGEFSTSRSPRQLTLTENTPVAGHDCRIEGHQSRKKTQN